jgi:hypothetical protein
MKSFRSRIFNPDWVWCLLIDKETSELRYGEEALKIFVSPDTDIHDLKEKIKQVRSDLAHVEATGIEVWEYRTNSARFLEPLGLGAVINGIEFSGTNTSINRVRVTDKVAAHIHTGHDVLLVRVPALHGSSKYHFLSYASISDSETRPWQH